MSPDEYASQIAQPNVLNGTTLNVTLKELAFVKETELVSALQRILAENRIEKPEAVSGKPDATPYYYRVDLSTAQLERIIDFFNDLEEQQTGPMAAFYGRLGDQWSALG
ncbi:hypothetical protein [Flaviaesturariibacter aridisoli]|uniref:Uncharacterized protein n=1 Tax=Flaviaesturariibacter aridisoli TaxID=2545761 RepID=A0A4R4DZS3_9BACT|nr:hypothetical protein [Flaviaesturariibacter aridisoli]TCZ72191.1 hypothetical protein E0486_08855 [Flaviaesturariibacter aridisoli]